jgi:general secretion pathway protein C
MVQSGMRGRKRRVVSPAFSIRYPPSLKIPTVASLPMQIPEPYARALAGVYERYGRYLPGLAAAVLAVLLGSTVADLVWSLFPVPESARWQPPPADANARRPQHVVDIDAIISAAVFGRYEAPVESAVTAPETPLNLTLMGILAADRERDSRALIAAQGGDEKAYAIGDDISRGVTLQAIFPDRVVLSRNGRLETLSLDREKAAAAGVAAAPAEEPATTTNSATAQQLAQIRDDVLQGRAKAEDYVRLQPSNVAGTLKGYRVYPGKDRAVFTAAGLRPGDLVTSVNGVQLDDPAKALQVLGDLGQANQVNLVVDRGGQSQNISLQLK